ncbi:carbohydrate kinase family protein [Nocardioides astragali]|uniref:Carbohydrate kinase n=1 Tax=Nocardioides astragali TaxID=1776736 RepID=A0ABW2N2S3_9ACTN|nr:carbohydrate kinase [Nocardioides astragali]
MLKTQPRHVLVVGESLVDVLATPAAPPVDAPGGSPLNVAVTLGRLGTPVSILTAIGDDDRGAALRDHLASSRVDIRPGPVLPRTSSAVARVGTDGAATYEFDISWPAVDQPDLSDVGIVHTGSIAFFSQPGAAAVGELLRTAHDSGVVTTLDPNVRPALVGDRDAAVRHLEATLPSVDVLKLSDEDASWLYPDTAHDDVVALLLQRGPRLVALTRGPAGSSLVTPTTRVDVPAPPTTVVDTVGAGDAWMGALIHGLFADAEPRRLLDRLDDATLRDLGARASRVAAATVATQGANPPWADPASLTPPVAPTTA